MKQLGQKTNEALLTRTVYRLGTGLTCLALLLMSTGCIGIIKRKEKGLPILLKTDSTSIEALEGEVSRLASYNSIRAKMDLKFEDNSFAEMGIAEKYRTADAEVIVQRPGKIFLRIQAPLSIASFDIAQMTSDGEHFRVAILNDGGSGKNVKFILGTNSADYAPLQKNEEGLKDAVDRELLSKVNAFANIRPQHFIEAILIKPIDRTSHVYSMSAIFQEEDDASKPANSPLRRVVRGYYLLDEYNQTDGKLSIARRFWFDRVGGIRIARQQIFDGRAEIESDIVFGAQGTLSTDSTFDRMPLQIEITRPKERYRIKVAYQAPELVSIGLAFRPELFVLENVKNLPMVDLDEKLKELGQKPRQ